MSLIYNNKALNPLIDYLKESMISTNNTSYTQYLEDKKEEKIKKL